MKFTLLCVLIVFVAGCPQGGDVTAPASTQCESVATRCRLEGGAIGICSYDAESQLVCMSQH